MTSFEQHVADSERAYEKIHRGHNPVALSLATSIERFYKGTNATRIKDGEYRDKEDCNAALAGVNLISLLDDYLEIIQSVPVTLAADGKNFYFARDLEFRCSQKRKLLACFPGPLPAEIGTLPNDDVEKYRAVITDKENKDITLISLLDSQNSINWNEIENQVRNLKLF